MYRNPYGPLQKETPPEPNPKKNLGLVLPPSLWHPRAAAVSAAQGKKKLSGFIGVGFSWFRGSGFRVYGVRFSGFRVSGFRVFFGVQV